MHFASRRTPLLSARAMFVVLAVALWFAGTLGVLHRSLHVPGLPAAMAHAGHAAHDVHEVHAAGAGQHAHVHAGHGVLSLFGEHTDAECRLYDQLAHGSAAPGVPLVVLPMLLPSATFAFLQGEAIARWVTLFDARGPPSTR